MRNQSSYTTPASCQHHTWHPTTSIFYSLKYMCDHFVKKYSPNWWFSFFLTIPVLCLHSSKSLLVFHYNLIKSNPCFATSPAIFSFTLIHELNWSVLMAIYSSGDETKKNGMGGACSTYGRGEGNICNGVQWPSYHRHHYLKRVSLPPLWTTLWDI